MFEKVLGYKKMFCVFLGLEELFSVVIVDKVLGCFKMFCVFFVLEEMFFVVI